MGTCCLCGLSQLFFFFCQPNGKSILKVSQKMAGVLYYPLRIFVFIAFTYVLVSKVNIVTSSTSPWSWSSGQL